MQIVQCDCTDCTHKIPIEDCEMEDVRGNNIPNTQSHNPANCHIPVAHKKWEVGRLDGYKQMIKNEP
jgi:hypothetical protein